MRVLVPKSKIFENDIATEISKKNHTNRVQGSSALEIIPRVEIFFLYMKLTNALNRLKIAFQRRSVF